MSQSSNPNPLSRRRWFAGAGAVGAVAAVAVVAPRVAVQPQEAAASSPSDAQRGGGYKLSEHVKRYYQTTRV
jgi:hypothetical protein